MRYDKRVTEKRTVGGQFIHLKAYVPAETYAAVNQAAYEAHVSLSEWVRRAIHEALVEQAELAEVQELGAKLFPGAAVKGEGRAKK
jgi:hypothetical protein